MQDLNDFQFFAAVVTHRGFSAASRALGVPKSRLSKRIALLEERLGVRLLERSTRRFRVTDVGNDIYRHASTLISEAEAIERLVTARLSEPQGLIRLSCPLGVQAILSKMLPSFLAKYPRLRVQLLISNRRVDLIGEGVDIAVRVREKLDTDVDHQMRTIGYSRLLLVASPSFLKEWGAAETPGDLGRLPTLAHAEGNAPIKWTLYGPNSETVDIDLEPRLLSGDFDVLHHAVLKGGGVGLLPNFYCHDTLRTGALVRLLPQWNGGGGIMHVVFTSRRGMLPGVRVAIDFVVEALSAVYRDMDESLS